MKDAPTRWRWTRRPPSACRSSLDTKAGTAVAQPAAATGTSSSGETHGKHPLKLDTLLGRV